MKKVVILVIIGVIIVVSGICFWIYIDEQENKKIDAQSITLKENMNIEFGKKVKVSDFIEKINGSLVEDYEIDTEKLGEIEVPFSFINIRNRKRPSKFTIKVIDVNAPKIFIGNSYSVNVGYNKNLVDELLSGDDIDDNPTREIIGEYDVNKIGSYSLTYIVTDSSGNQTKKDFTLNVKKQSTAKPTKSEKLDISDVIRNYKQDDNKIGIDVSKWQKEIDWEAVKNSGIEFAIIRMGYQTDYDGEYVLDPYFISNIEEAKKVIEEKGLNYEIAKWVIENLKNYEIDLPIAFDWESWNSFNKAEMSFNTINKVANTFLDNLENAGYKGMLYSSKTYLEKIWYPTKHKTWLAQYNKEATYKGEYCIWQMSSIGKVNGINGDVDIDIMYLDKF